MSKMKRTESASNIPRLRFTEEEAAEKMLKKPVRKVRKAAAKLEKAENKIPIQKALAVERATDAKSGKPVARLRIRKVAREKPTGKPSGMAQDALRAAPTMLLRQTGQQQDANAGDNDVGSVGVEAAEQVLGMGETALRFGADAQQTHTLRPYQRMEKAEARLDQANKRYLKQKTKLEHRRAFSATDTPQTLSGKARNRKRQQRAVLKEYAMAKKRGVGTSARRTISEVTGQIGQSFRKNKRFLSLAGLGFMLIAMVMNGLSSCSPIIQSAFQAIAVSTYPADEADMKAAERAYAAMEQEMRDYLNWYEWTHDYDEYEYDTDELWHDPHVLMAILSAWNNGEAWVMDDKPYDQLALIFDQQYKLEEEVTRSTRYRTVNGELEPYYYYSCKVTLINENLSHRPVYFMSEEQLGMYAMYMSTLGNYPDLFRFNRYASTLREPGEYDIPEEALQDSKFARLIEEAEKYIGYPYVWGGTSPTTSFDCSGFVSWVYTNSGVLNIGRLGVTSLYNMCTPISAEQARPGDMVFFEGTINRHDGLSHVGIYVGGGMMLHCGSPIGYADLNSSYYQSHLFGYGRPPM